MIATFGILAVPLIIRAWALLRCFRLEKHRPRISGLVLRKTQPRTAKSY